MRVAHASLESGALLLQSLWAALFGSVAGSTRGPVASEQERTPGAVGRDRYRSGGNMLHVKVRFVRPTMNEPHRSPRDHGDEYHQSMLRFQPGLG